MSLRLTRSVRVQRGLLLPGRFSAQINRVPVASNVAISGSPVVGATLTGSYDYSDPDGSLEGTSTFRWLRDDVAISGATSSTYELVEADEGAVIKFEVTPVAVDEPTTGTPVQSAGTSAVIAEGATYYASGGGSGNYLAASTDVMARLMFPGGGSLGDATYFGWFLCSGGFFQFMDANDDGSPRLRVYADVPDEDILPLAFLYDDGATLRASPQDGDALPLSTWNFIAVRVASGVLTLVVNDTLVAGGTPAGTYGTIDAFALLTTTSAPTLGVRNIHGISRALSDLELAALYDAGETHNVEDDHTDWTGQQCDVDWYLPDVGGSVPNTGTGGTCNLTFVGTGITSAADP